jgi:hypothetical protein
MGYFKNFQKVGYDLDGDGYSATLTNLTHFSRIGTKYLDDVSFYSYYNVSEGERPDMVSYKLYDTTEYYWTFFIINSGLFNAFNDWPKGTADLSEFVESKYPNLAAVSAQINATSFDEIAGKFNIGETVQGGVSGALGTIVAKYPTLGYIEIRPTSGTFREDGEGIYGIASQDFLNTSSIIKRAYAPRYHTDITTGEQTFRRVAGTQPYTNFEYEYERNIEKSKIRVIKPRYIQDVVREFRKEMQSKSA